MMGKEGLEEEGPQEITLEMSIFRHLSLMPSLTRRNILIGCKPLKGSLNSKSIMMKSPSS